MNVIRPVRILKGPTSVPVEMDSLSVKMATNAKVNVFLRISTYIVELVSEVYKLLLLPLMSKFSINSL